MNDVQLPFVTLITIRYVISKVTLPYIDGELQVINASLSRL